MHWTTRPVLHKLLFVPVFSSYSSTFLTAQTWPQVTIIYFDTTSHLRGCCFEDDEGFTEATEAWFVQQSKDFYKTGFMSLNDKWSKWIEVNGDYTEKQNKNCFSASLPYTLFAKHFECPIRGKI